MAYAVLVVSALFFEIALNLPVGTMPLVLMSDGASRAAAVGAMGGGTFAALLVSLPLGALADRFGRLVMIRSAGLVGVVTLLVLAFAHGALPGGLLLALRSIALVAYMTAEFAYAGELASDARAVSGVATLGMIGNLSFAIAPAFSVFLWQHGIGRVQYAYGAAFAAIGVACLFALPKRYDIDTGVRRATIVVRAQWLPACFFALASTLQGGVNVALAVLTFQERGIVNGAAIFTAMALTAFALRYPAGRLVDRFGARTVAFPTALIQAGGCVLAAHAHGLGAVVLAGACLGTAWAAVVPVALGLLFEHSSRATRGAAMGAYNLAFSGGQAIGAVVATFATLAGPGYPLAMSICALAPLIVLPYVLRSGGAVGGRTALGSATGD